jgi:hypothetical protein
VDGIDPFSGTIRDWHHSAKVRHDGASWMKRRRQGGEVAVRVGARCTEDAAAAATVGARHTEDAAEAEARL